MTMGSRLAMKFIVAKCLSVRVTRRQHHKHILFDYSIGGSRGGGGQGAGPPGKSQVIWISIGNKQLRPPTPMEKVGPPLKNVGHPLEPLEMSIFESNHWTSVK